MNKNLTNYFSMFALCISLYLLTCCVPSDASKTYFGPYMSENHTKNAILLTVAPKEPIAVCTSSTEIFNDIKKAILTWAKAIDRDQFMNVVSCDTEARVKITATAGDIGATPSYIYPSSGELTYSNNTNVFNAENRFPLLLHEIGHAWGLCDQYENKDARGNSYGPYNCGNFIAGHGNNDKVADSVMGKAIYSELQEDDIAGIKRIIKVANNTTNKAWLNKEKAIQINSDTTDTSASHLKGKLSINKSGTIDYDFVYTQTGGTLNSSHSLRICLLDKYTCLNKDVDHKQSNPRIIPLGLYDARDKIYTGNTSSSQAGRFKINAPSKIYLLELDENNNLVFHKEFTIPASMSRYL